MNFKRGRNKKLKQKKKGKFCRMPVLNDLVLFHKFQNPLFMAPNFSKYAWRDKVHPTLGIAGEMQHNNAALAMQLCHMWRKNNTLSKSTTLIKSFQCQKKSVNLLRVSDYFVCKLIVIT